VIKKGDPITYIDERNLLFTVIPRNWLAQSTVYHAPMQGGPFIPDQAEALHLFPEEENITWIHGHHMEGSSEAAALRAAHKLARSRAA
jgi:hypothetical protein